MALNIQLLRTSFEAAKPIANTVVTEFYSNLFRDYPDSKGVFENVDMERQKNALIHSLVFIVDHLEDGEKLTGYLKKMGARHVRYGTQTEHYAWVGASLLKTFAKYFGDDWTPELSGAWTDAYGVIAELMQAGAREAGTQAKKASISERVQKLTEEMVVSAIQGMDSARINQLIREKAEQLLAKSLDEIAQEVKPKVQNAA